MEKNITKNIVLTKDLIVKIQDNLNKDFNQNLKLDGILGPKTKLAIKIAQEKYGLNPDGFLNDSTIVKIIKDDPVSLIKPNFNWASKELNCEINAIRAISQVESTGKGFLNNGLPVILFERHQMYRELNKRKINPENFVNKYPNIVNKRPGAYKGKEKEYPRLNIAKSINEEAALCSASWGAYQIMGYHWKRLKYPSVKDFVEHMYTNEQAHLEAFVKFIKSDNDLLKAIREKNWLNFARIYNGPSQKGYDKKIALAYAKLKQVNSNVVF